MSASDSTQCVSVHLELRSRQANYLQRIAERDGISVSKAFGKAVDQAIKKIPVEESISPKKERLHLSIQVRHLVHIDSLSSRLGIWRAEVIRRLIDEVMEIEMLESEITA